MSETVQIIDIAEPMQSRDKKDGSGQYNAMKITVKMSDGALKTLMSFDEKKIGESVVVEEKNGYLNIVKPQRGYDKPAQSNQTDVMQAIRMLYTLTAEINTKVDALIKDVGVEVGTVDISSAVHAAILDQPLPEPTGGLDKFRQAREQSGLVKEDVAPEYEEVNKPIDLSEIPF